jgi:hypothetical protein
MNGYETIGRLVSMFVIILGCAFIGGLGGHLIDRHTGNKSDTYFTILYYGGAISGYFISTSVVGFS